MKNEPKWLVFCSWNSTPEDLLSATSPKIQTLPTHLTQIIHTHFTLRHTSHSHSSNPFTIHTQNSNTSDTPRTAPLRQTHTGPHNLSLFKPKYSQTHTGRHSHSHFHSHSNLAPRHSESQTYPHNISLTLKPTSVLTVSHSSNPNTVKPKHRSSVSHSSNLAPTDLVTLQTLTLTLPRATTQPHHSSKLAPLLNLNLKVGTPS